MSEQVFDRAYDVERDGIPFDQLPAGEDRPVLSPYAFLGVLPPGAILGGLLERIDRSELSGHDLVHVLGARQRQISHLQAELLADITELGYCPPSDAGDPPRRVDEFFESTADEVRAALSWTRTAAEAAVVYALAIIQRFPRLGDALGEGLIDLPRAKVIVDAVFGLDDAIARQVIEEILEVAPPLTTGQLRHRLRRLCIDADPDAAKKRYDHALEQRRVVGGEGIDGTADLMGENLPAERVAGILSRLNRQARRLRRQGDQRTMDQLRADLFLDWLEGNHHHGAGHPGRLVDIRADLDTLIRLNDRAAEIPGWGPVIADIARQALEQQPDGTWRVVVTDPDTDAVLWNGITQRRPTTAQRRYVEARQTECTFPTCRMPSHLGDLDHLREYSRGGLTKVDNLQPPCRHDHDLKTKGYWKVERTRPGVYTWISPHGHRYTKPP